jgi:type II secretory pathway component PulM
MEHEMAMRQMRAHLARAGREIQSARQFLATPEGEGTNLALARALANATASIDDAMDTIQQSLSERGGS